MAQDEVIMLLKRYIALLQANGINIQKAFLYGSFARNEQSKESDIDVMLISDQFETAAMEVRARPWQYTRKVDSRIEPFSIGYKTFFSDDDSALVSEVKKEGIEIAI